ncbi:MAG: DNA recombination protein RmuC, partial [Clostridia bacterium]
MATIILATISVVLSLGALATTIAVAIKLYRKPNASTLSDNAEFELLTSNLADAVKLLKEHISTENSSSEKSLLTAFTVATTTSNNNIDNSMKGFKADVEKIATTTQTQLGEIRNEMKETMTSVRNDVTTNLTKVQENNEKQLEQMRLTVDEKLTSTLNTRIKNAFDTIGERLEAVQKGFGEMQSLSEKVGNLSKVFNNVKTTGNWGEVALETLLDQILAQEQYDRQVRVKKNSKEMVDFAIKMPGGAGKEVLLPIDAKFPTADFERLVTAIDTESADEIVASRKALYERVKTFAKDISAKYIDPPTTTNFAILYLPTEGLYAEIIRNGALCSELQNKHRITVCGPTTITALLNSLQI